MGDSFDKGGDDFDRQPSVVGRNDIRLDEVGVDAVGASTLSVSA
jgi:hypothetical protein